MHTRASSLFAALALFTLPGLARPDDDAAQRLLTEARGHWNDATPDEALRLALAALDAQPSSVGVELQVHLFLGSLHQAKTGDFDAALAELDLVIQALFDVQDPLLRQLKADAMVRKGTVLYSEKNDAAAALQLYQSAHRTFQLSTTADAASQLAFRMGRDGSRTATDRRTFMDLALALAREAVALAPRQFPEDEKRRASNLDKCRLQLVLVLTAGGQKDEAHAAWSAIDVDRLGDAGLYQLGVLRALEGDAEAATALLLRSLHLPVRASPGSRNALRKFVRTEPDLAALRARPDWKELLEDEPEPARPARRAGPPRPLRLSVPRQAPPPVEAPFAAAPPPVAPPTTTAHPAAPAAPPAATPPRPAATPASAPPPAPAEPGNGRRAAIVIGAVVVAVVVKLALGRRSG